VDFEEQLKESPPDFFAFSVGTNDANVPYASFNPETYKRNLEQMMLKVLRANPKCAILLTVPNDAAYHKRYTNPNVARERDVIIELARKYQCPVWDFYGIMGELGSSRTWLSHGLMQGDMVHFTSVGYHLKAHLFEDAWEKWLQQMDLRKR
jgi:lysophospholipase L1-like esterase